MADVPLLTPTAHDARDHTGVTGAGGGLASGTAFPGSPTADDLFYRTDRNLIYFYDGTRWLTINEYDMGIGGINTAGALAATGTVSRYPVRQDYGIFLVRWAVVTFVATTNTGSAFWTPALERRTAANASTTIASFSTGTGPDTVDNWVNHDQTINAVLDSSARQLQVFSTKTSTPGTLIVVGTVVYRLIG